MKPHARKWNVLGNHAVHAIKYKNVMSNAGWIVATWCQWHLWLTRNDPEPVGARGKLVLEPVNCIHCLAER